MQPSNRQSEIKLGSPKVMVKKLESLNFSIEYSHTGIVRISYVEPKN